MYNSRLVDDVLTELRYKPTSTALYERLVTTYSKTDEQGRAYIRGTITSLENLVPRIAEWRPGRVADNPTRFVQYRLTIISMLDGYPSYTKTLEELRDLWTIAERYSLNAAKLFEQAAKRASGNRKVSVKYLMQQVLEENTRS